MMRQDHVDGLPGLQADDGAVLLRADVRFGRIGPVRHAQIRVEGELALKCQAEPSMAGAPEDVRA
jgi:hypothetical protein